MTFSCFVESCSNAVVGQCPGVPEGGMHCGKFVCAEHSTNGMCHEHAEKKELYMQFDEYGEGIERLVGYSVGRVPKAITITTAFIGLAFPPLLIIAVPFGIYWIVKDILWNSVFNSLKKKPNFDLFWDNIGKPYYKQLYKGSHESLTHFTLSKAGDIGGEVARTNQANRMRRIETDIRSIANKM